MTGTRIIETAALNVGWVRSSNIQAGQCDTTTAHGKLILTVLAGLAEFERSLIIGRTQAGIARAKQLGVTFGRPAKLNSRQRRMIAARYAKGETMATLAAEFGVGEATVWRALRGEPAA